MTSQAISEIPLGDSCNLDLEVASFTERLHKRIVKRGVSLFLSADFLKDDRLVAAIKKLISLQLTY